MQPYLSLSKYLLANTPDANQSSAHDQHHVTQGRHIYITLFHVCTIQMRICMVKIIGRASSQRRLVHVRRDILLHNMRRRWRSLLLGQCTTVEPCMPTPKSKVSKHKSNAYVYSVSLPTLRPWTIYQIWVSLLNDSHPNDKRIPKNLPSSSKNSRLIGHSSRL